MNKAFKTILIISIAFFGVGILLIPSTWAQAQNLIIQFEQNPLFNEANFLPGQGVTRSVKVTNNSGSTQRIATEAINVSDPDNLGAVLNLEIKEGGVTHYNNAFSKFFTGGEAYLSDLTTGTQTQYDFIVTFYSGTQNTFQGKSLGFDILVGFQGEEGGLLPGVVVGAGGFLPPGLTIQDKSVKIIMPAPTSITINWTTSYLSTSQVIYGAEGESHTLDLNDNTGTPPKYGYAHTTPESDISPKVIDHWVTITGLTPNTKYYFRTVSHASLAISQEHSFTTLGVNGEEEIPLEEITPSEEEKPFEEGKIPETIEEVLEKITEEGKEITEAEPIIELEELLAEEEIITFEQEKLLAGNLGLLANIGIAWGEISQSLLTSILVTILLIVLLLILIKESRKWAEKRRKKY